MKERPILFSAPMVKAILDGSKTQTRRVVKHADQCDGDIEPHPEYLGEWYQWNQGEISAIFECPYGQVGDEFWVRETCEIFGFWVAKSPKGHRFAIHHDKKVRYSDHDDYCLVDTHKGLYGGKSALDAFQIRPSIHTPRWTSRIQLRITNVRVERLHDISEKDAWAEGCEGHDDQSGWSQFQELWENINGPKNWAENPWVWVIEFERVKP